MSTLKDAVPYLMFVEKLACYYPEAYVSLHKEAGEPKAYGFAELKTHVFKNADSYKKLRDLLKKSPNIAMTDLSNSNSELAKLAKELRSEAVELAKEVNLLKGTPVKAVVDSLIADLMRIALKKCTEMIERAAAKSKLEEEASKIFKNGMITLHNNIVGYFEDRLQRMKAASISQGAQIYLRGLIEELRDI